MDPRALTAAALKAARHRGVDISSGTTVTHVLLARWARHRRRHRQDEILRSCDRQLCRGMGRELAPHQFPTRPVKGQMLSLAAASRDLLRHVIRAPEIYLVPRSDGRILAGATVEEAGYDKRTDADTIQRMHQAAIRSGARPSPGPHAGSVGRIAARLSRQSAHSRRHSDRRLFRRDRSLPRRHSAHPDHCTCDGADHHRR